MNAVEYLTNIKLIERAIRLKREEIEELRTLAESIAIKTGEEPVQTSGTSDKVGNIVARIVDMEKELEESMLDYINKRTECIMLLDKMDINEREVLYRRYIQDMKWDDVADAMGYSSEHVRGTLHTSALNTFENLLHNLTE